MAFTVDVDIANRALQHCGEPRIDPTLGFTEVSQRAQETQFAYGKIKRSLLRSDVWRFSTRKAVLRPIDTNTMLLSPAMWGPTFTYFVDSIVSDSTGFLWISTAPNNLNNQPGQPGAIFAWAPYFGPLTVSLYDSSQVYFAGELVYTAAGDGTYNVYKSQLSENALDPSLPNQWSAAATYYQNKVVQGFPAYAGGTTYAAGATVTYTDGNTYSSLIAGNVGNAPSATVGTKWAPVPLLTIASQMVPITTIVGPLANSPVIEWTSVTTYSIGSFVMFNGTEYVSLANNNTAQQPNAAASAFWAALTGGTFYMSLINLNINNNPASAPALWVVGTTYATGNQVGGSDGQIYTSVGNGNVGNNPVTDGGVHWTATGVLNPWTTVFTLGGGNQQWLQIGGASAPAGVALSTPNITYPLGAGPYEQAQTKNVYRLPAGFLRTCSQDPKAGAVSWLGVPGNLGENDWEYEGNYFTTCQGNPIPYRFQADVVDVTQFDDMFCETLAFEIALAVVAPLTQSVSKEQTIQVEYKRYKDDAKTVNGIEIGWVNPPLDDLIACRA